jgi:hypothetical protein
MPSATRSRETSISWESFGSKWVRRSLTLPWGKTANCCLGTIYPCQGAADVVTVIT